MSENTWNDYARERHDAETHARVGVRRIGGQVFDEADVPDVDDVPALDARLEVDR